MENIYKISMVEEQMRVLRQALSLFSRIGVGDCNALAENLDQYTNWKALEVKPLTLRQITGWTDRVKIVLFNHYPHDKSDPVKSFIHQNIGVAKNLIDHFDSCQVTHKQLRVIEKALDLFTRIGIGQLDAVAWCLDEHINWEVLGLQKHLPWEMIRDIFNPMKTAVLGHPGNGSWGVGNQGLHPDIMVCYDMEKVVQNVIAKEENHERFSVWHRGSGHYGNQPDITIEKKEKKCQLTD